jgi:hypothetical protein
MHITVPISHIGIIRDSFPRCRLVLGRVSHDVRDRLHDFSSSPSISTITLERSRHHQLQPTTSFRGYLKFYHVTMGGQGKSLVASKTIFAK